MTESTPPRRPSPASFQSQRSPQGTAIRSRGDTQTISHRRRVIASMPSATETRRDARSGSVSGGFVCCGDVDQSPWYRAAAPYLPIVALIAAVAACEMMSALLMFVYSGIYAAIADRSRERFVRVICLSLLLAALQALAEATKIYCRDYLALSWRRELTRELEGAVKKTLHLASHQPTRLLPPTDQLPAPDLAAGLATHLGSVPNLDQRVAQDVAELCDTAAKIVAAVVVLPAVVLFYTCYLAASIGPLSPFLCFLYFLVSIAVSYPIAQRVSPVVYAQGRLEGDFRLQWTRVLAQWPSIVLWQGGAPEVHASATQFQQLWHNQRVLLRRQWLLNTATQGFQYAGSIVTYAIVGVSIVYLQAAAVRREGDADGDEAQWSTTVVRWTRGTYAALALIHAFTTVTDALGWWSTATGLANRVLAVLLAARPAADRHSDRRDPQRGPAILSGWWGAAQSATPLYDPLTTREAPDGGADATEAAVDERSPLERRRQRDPWGLWSLLREVQRSRAIRSRLSAAEVGGGGRAAGGGGAIQLQRWTADRGASPSSDESPDAVERGYAAQFREHFERSPLRGAASDDDSDDDGDEGSATDDGRRGPRGVDDRRSDVAATLAALEAQASAAAASPCDWFHVRNWSLYAAADASDAADGAPQPSRRLLQRDVSFSVTSGTRLLVSGPTGCGKSTLLFALTQQLRASRGGGGGTAPLFPHLQWPPGGAPRRLRVLHCPQTPYVLAEASLVANVFYPKRLRAASSPRQRHLQRLAEELLGLVGLVAHPATSLAATRTADAPARGLSQGEQQCLSVARLLFHVARRRDAADATVAFLDEATSAMDEDCEAVVYGLLRRYVAAYVSVGHRSTVRPFHRAELRLAKGDAAAWSLVALPPA